MDEMESKLGALLSNPEMMQKIMSIAQSFQSTQPSPQQDAPPPQQSLLPNVDISTIQRLAGFAQQSSIDKNQQTLLRALEPYLSKPRITKLEKAMRAAKMANMASLLLNNPQFHAGR